MKVSSRVFSVQLQANLILTFTEPFDLTNTARSVYDCETFERIKAVFIASWKILQETMDLNAIFSPIVTASLNQVPLNITTTIS